MTSNVVSIKPAVTHRCCPGCGYMVAQIKVDKAWANYTCPHCFEHRLNEFQPMRLGGTDEYNI